MSRPTNTPSNQDPAPKPSPPSISHHAAPAPSTDMTRPCTIAPSPDMPSFAYETPEECQVRKRQKHNRIGRKYRSKLSDKFEGLQAILVQTAFLNLDAGALVPGMSAGEVLELIRRQQEEEEEREGEDDGGKGKGRSPGASGSSSSAAAGRRGRVRRSKSINKAGILAMARKTVVKFRAVVEELLRELEESDEE